MKTIKCGIIIATIIIIVIIVGWRNFWRFGLPSFPTAPVRRQLKSQRDIVRRHRKKPSRMTAATPFVLHRPGYTISIRAVLLLTTRRRWRKNKNKNKTRNSNISNTKTKVNDAGPTIAYRTTPGVRSSAYRSRV